MANTPELLRKRGRWLHRWLGLAAIFFTRRVSPHNTYSMSRAGTRLRVGRALTVREGSALPDLDNITVRIADVAANLAVLGYRLRDELGSSTFP
jgi:hypothetical protein